MKSLSFFLFLILLIFPIMTDHNSKAARGLASSWNMIPSRSLAGLHYIYKGYTEEEGSIKVSGPVVEITNGHKYGSKLHPEGYISEVDPEDFEMEQILGRSIFEATGRTGTNVGTAFLVGKNLVLTNRHVMNYGPKNSKWACGKFAIKLNHREERINCKKVRFCSSLYDYCVIELNPTASGAPLGDEVRPLRLASSMRSNPDASLLHIGNAGGLGLQASRGRGIKIQHGEFYHYVPTLGGSSGAPIFNDKYEVVGINWGHTGENLIDEAAFNRGVLTDTIFKELSRTHPYTLKDIKSFRSKFLRSQRHREVKIEVK
ncbi:MAG: serine protease [Bacteriovoracaceae bacterium]